jgi:phosphate transport system ATP-binding protein
MKKEKKKDKFLEEDLELEEMKKTSDLVFKVENLNLHYGEKQALKNLNFEIKKNEVTAFIGPSGCGKSTMIRCFNRMNDLIPDCKIEGDIYYYGKNINDFDVSSLRTKVGMVFQSPNPFPMSIYDNIAYGPRCQGIKDKEVLNEIVANSLKKAALYEEVKDRLKESALELSGGQQQRLCIARAIAMEPDVILMDEPTSALDPIATAKIEELIFDLKKEYTIVIVTHNLQQATRISDVTVFFLLGEIIEVDSTLKLFKSPSKKETEDYITGRFG